MKRPRFKPLSERNPVIVGLVSTVVLTALVVGAFEYDKLPFVNDSKTFTAYFAEAGGIHAGDTVRVSGLGVGRVKSIKLDGTRVRVKFTVRKNVELGERTEAAIKTETVLGSKMLELTPRGDGQLSDAIPLERTKSPYDLPDALGDVTNDISGLDTNQLSSALTTLADTLKATPSELRPALQNVARFSDTLNTRDAQLRHLLANANKVSGVLARRSEQIAALVGDANALLAALLQERSSIDVLLNNLTSVSHQISGLVDDNRAQLKPALDKLNGVLEILDNRKAGLQRALSFFKRYAMSFGEVLGSGPFFKAYVANLLPGQLTQPFVDALLGHYRDVDPGQKSPSEAAEPPTGSPPVPPAPVVPPAPAPPVPAGADGGP